MRKKPLGFKVAHLAADNQVKDASGGPAGGQTFEKFDQQAWADFMKIFEDAITSRNEWIKAFATWDPGDHPLASGGRLFHAR
ncbi:hypothetical protein [Desulfoluna spongiiphila]|uniref:hypothetical protein n=1 Tax=Desulfoluna spongiiphila TaxID=419481 RepID=UPI000B8576A6|nr:hypothetical protein [Desulfoluna spongiiphila]